MSTFDNLPRVRVTGLACGVAPVMTLASFLRDNEQDTEVCGQVRSLRQGQSVNIGGGAAPLMRVERLFDGAPSWPRFGEDWR